MPRKRRQSKRKTDVATELAAWSSWFESGVAFDGELEDVGAVDPVSVPEEEGRAVAYGVARDAWMRLGALFLETHQSDARQTPYAMEMFGAPTCR
ncbi:hypothetical protein ACVIHI_002669 [Bradyrhizobium sp. USDA 4524]|uniref:hypothetical protein n=1 Tax=unclassified Bradyrhizobium TaxID=2631580 RepID=UPI00209F6046|nr:MULTISPECIES: hypothetical protein [unclassified Bradyrhizobium]MCP1844410.1 hypothetical protein [Bradyrhizobium sp. USDA 4538]MCP1904976.1 hypothetical protein [Bradyrhizobium sp. USDA 4537]MCP1989368.1 hypothetical protein [Bradyrhizobium sp. USDA 4539]